MTEDQREAAEGLALTELARAMVSDFSKLGGENYLAFTFSDNHSADKYEVVVQRKNGMTPSDKVTALEAEIERLREALEEARGTMRCARYMKTSLVLSACLGAGIKEINDVLKDQPDPYITQMEATDD